MKSLSKLVNLYTFSPGRCLFSLKAMEQRLVAGGDGLEDLVARVRQSLEDLQSAQALEARWKGNRGQLLHGGEAKRLDAELDRVLGALDGALGAALQALGDDDPQGQAVAGVRERLFPKGVADMIRLPYVEQAEEVTALLRRAGTETEVIQVLDAFGLEIYLERVRSLHARYVAALQPDDPLTWDEVKAARAEAHERFCAIVCSIAGRAYASAPESDERQALEAALQVAWEQNRAIRIARQRRRGLSSDESEDHVLLGADAEATGAESPPARPFALPDVERKAEDVA